ncbi:TspO/MBR family protein [Leucobacter sp. HY1910]
MAHPTPPITRQIGVAALFLVAVTAVAALGSIATIPHTDGWYASVNKVPWSPPNAVFGPAWTALYALIAIAGFLIWRAGYAAAGQPSRAQHQLRLFAVQLVLNGLWTPLFFASFPLVGAIAWWAALVVIVALIVVVIRLIAITMPISRPAAWMFVPYLLWLIFAASLNAGIIVLN